MKNKALKICLTGLALSVAGLVNAETTTVLTVHAKPVVNDVSVVGRAHGYVNGTPTPDPLDYNKPFMPTEIEVNQGDVIKITVDMIEQVAYNWDNNRDRNPNYEADADGAITGRWSSLSHARFLVPNTVSYSLVGFIGVDATDLTQGGALVKEGALDAGDGFVGSNYDQTASASGYLYLAFNDDVYYDNSGSWEVTITTPGDPGPLASCNATPREAIAGGYISVAADSSANACLAAKGYVTIGANTTAHDIYAGSYATIYANANVDNVFSGAATTLGSDAVTKNIHAGAAITFGADGIANDIYAGAAITYGAGAYSSGTFLPATANITSTVPEDIHNAVSMSAALLKIDVVRAALAAETANFIRVTTSMGTEYLSPGVHQGGALNVTASSTIIFDASSGTGTSNGIGGTNYRWVMNFGTLTVGASTNFVTAGLGPNDTATIIWNVDTVTLGASTSFRGTVFADGPFTAATSVVTCGNIYATGLISLLGIGVEMDGTTAMCDSDAVFGYLD
jgi:hypothetical protein